MKCEDTGVTIPSGAENWIREQGAHHGYTTTTPWEIVHERPWSQVVRVPTTRGNLFFKMGAHGQRHEAGAAVRLAAWSPDFVLPVVAADEERGWLLLPDGGSQRFRETLKADVASGN